MKRFLTIVAFIFSTVCAHAQSTTFLIKGTIKDATSGETLIGASVMAKPGVGAVSDLDGNYSIKVEPGTYSLKVNYVGYTPQTIKVKVVDKDVVVDIILESQMLDEVEISANIGTVRETPVAISNISQEKLQEEIGGRDITMVMNSTPGVYASQSGGGAGDSRVTLRGFDQTNIAVLVDGVPVNDMENGAVYWSNWDGLKDITKTIQIQRGLGATKLAVASVGGTMNIITQGIDQKQTTSLKREYGNNNYQSTTLSYNSGLLKNKFGIVFAGSYRTGDGWVQQTWNEAWSYYIKLQWKVNNRHLLSFNCNGAPQKHGQRNNKYTIGTYSLKFAEDVGIVDPEKNMLLGGVTTVSQGPRPLYYNANVGRLNGEDYNIFVNFYHKPLFNLSHFWNATDKLSISTVAYASFGTGGGTSLSTGVVNPNPTLGYINLDNYYLGNTTSSLTGTNAWYSTTERRSSSIVTAARNDHKWYGLLSTASYQLDSAFRLTFGIDARLYRGLHYGQVYDLLGGGYYVNNSDNNQPKGLYAFDPRFKYSVKKEGDKILYNYDGMVDWGGLFGQ
ncbi:MAG TPA: TonB-dependent receptor, partial [Bacteroidia bacterium]